MEFTTVSNAKRQTGLSYLGGIATSAKMSHSKDYSHQYTYAIYLAPASTSGFNVCSHSTVECRLGCLNTSGRAAIDIYSGHTKIQDARIKKTRLFHENNDFFMAWMFAEIKSAQAKAKKHGYYFSVRLNATSDINWQHVYYGGKNVFEIFPEVSFYDYTKNHNKFNDIPKNYHLTLSYTGRNWNACKEMIARGHNVAMVFNVRNEKFLPKHYKGYTVINGDLTDYRIDDAKGIIVGLKWKRIANKENERKVLNSVFVVTLNQDHAINLKPIKQ